MAGTRLARWFVGIFGGVLVLLWIAVAIGSRSSVLRDALVDVLSAQLDSQVELQAFSVSVFPTLSIQGQGLRLRHKGRTDVPPLIEIRSFSATGGIWGLLRRPRRVRTVTLEGLTISIPPGGVDREGEGGGGSSPTGGPVIIDHLVSTNAALVLVPRDSRKEPRRFAIHDLRMDDLGFNRAMPFKATLTNPIPEGRIVTSGTFGPWQAAAPGATPLNGTYEFRNARMNTIDGLGGTLSSDGQFNGALGRIDVQGTSTIPDFSLDVAAQPVSLETRFHVVVDGTDGDTYLKQVDAKLAETPIRASGAITGTPGKKGRTIDLHVTIADGRIQDVLKLAVNAAQPPMLGALNLKTSLLLPPGPGKVAERLRLEGDFGLADAKFTDNGVQQKIGELSHRSRGKNADDEVARVLSDLRGHFSVRDGLARFSNLRFGVPGAQVQLAGSYGLRTEALDFRGTLRMQATVSEASGGGIKGFFLKAIDPLFKKKGAGAVVPIRIQGTRDKPKFGLDVGRVF